MKKAAKWIAVLGVPIAVLAIMGARTLDLTGSVTNARVNNNWAAISESLLNSTNSFPAKGTITANKVVVAGTSGAITSGGNFTTTGTVTAEHLTTSDDLQVDDDATVDGNLTVAGNSQLANLTVTGNLTRTAQERIACGGYSKVGATAGWTVGGGAVNTGLTATLPASQTSSTLVVPCFGLKVGDTITGFEVVGQIESTGTYSVTLDATLRVHTAAAGDVSDAAIDNASITQVSTGADQILAEVVSSLTHVVDDDETFYVLLTGTTQTTTDIALQGINVTTTEQ